MSANVKIFEAAKNGAADAFTSYILGLERTAQSRDEINNTPLHYAAANGHLDLVQIFLLNEADVNAVNNFRETPLHCAAGKGQVDVVKRLLSVKDINLDLQTDEGWTALHLAAEKGHPEVVELLVNHGANVDIQDKGGESAVEYAHSPQIVKVISAASSMQDVLSECEPKEESPPPATTAAAKDVLNLDTVESVDKCVDESGLPATSGGSEVINTFEHTDKENGGTELDTIDIEGNEVNEKKSVEGDAAATATASTNQCCVIM